MSLDNKLGTKGVIVTRRSERERMRGWKEDNVVECLPLQDVQVKRVGGWKQGLCVHMPVFTQC